MGNDGKVAGQADFKKFIAPSGAAGASARNDRMTHSWAVRWPARAARQETGSISWRVALTRVVRTRREPNKSEIKREVSSAAGGVGGRLSPVALPGL